MYNSTENLINFISKLLFPQIVLVFDQEFNLLYFSENTPDEFDYGESELYGLPFEKIFFWESLSFSYLELRRILSQKNTLRFEGFCLKKGENIFPAAVSLGFLTNESDQQKTLFCIIDNQSKQKRQILELQENNRSKEQIINMQARQIDELFIQLEHKEIDVNKIHERLKIYTKLMSYINSVWDIDMLLSGYLDILSIMNISYASSVYIKDKNENIFKLKAVSGIEQRLIPGFLDSKNPLINKITQQKQSIIIHTGEYYKSFTINTPLGPWTPNAVIMFPIINMEDILGVLTMSFGHKPTQAEVEFFEHLIAQLGLAIHNLSQYSNLKQLAETLHEQSIEIEAKNTELEKASLMKSVFLTNMSHELHTPLTAIMGFTEIIRDELFGPINEKQKELLKDIYIAGSQLMRMVDTLLSISKIESGKIHKDENMFIFQNSMEGEIRRIEEKAKLHEVSLTVDFPKAPVYIQADELKIRTILLNLGLNAVKYTPRGGKVKITASTENKNLYIKVEDNGIGIDEAYHTDIFKAFHQVLPEEGQLPAGGAGLGLSLAKKFAELHGGTISVQSEKHKGSVFTVFLPNIIIDAALFETIDSDID